MSKYRIQITNDKDREFNASGDTFDELIENIKERCDWNGWLECFEGFNWSPEKIEEEKNCGVYYFGGKDA